MFDEYVIASEPISGDSMSASCGSTTLGLGAIAATPTVAGEADDWLFRSLQDGGRIRPIVAWSYFVISH